jgi:serine O-acetyltransferase
MIRLLWRDLRTVLERDPATKSMLEAFLCSPGFHALLFYRPGHWLYRRRRYLAARLLSHLGRWLTGIEIHPGAVIGPGFFIDHGAGVVIGETTVIGENVTIYQGVTLGGTGKETGKRHPTIGNDVVIGAGAIILGSITIGDDVRIGAGSVVVRPVPPHSTVVGVPGHVVRRYGRPVTEVVLEHGCLPDPLVQALQDLAGRVDRLGRRVDELQRSQAQPPPASAAAGQPPV